MRIIGLDFGEKTVGVALSDEMGLTAQPYTTVHRDRPTKLRQTLAKIETIISENEVSLIVLGLPKGLDNVEGEMCERVREFGERLSRRTSLPVEYVDERLTTKEAGRVLEEANVRKTERKKYVDKMAAALILKTYLEMNPSAKQDDTEE
ncbi:MAG: Holliday junction resolvase RuvX [Lachnospiraceae bacterium]|nr:Holliday junction resolvase RuvX [Lachnospiraceae bacterium]